MKTWVIVGIIVVVIGGYLWGGYNSLTAGRERVDAQWAQVQAQYQRRFDLIPNLVESVRGAMQQEQTVFSQLAEARTRYAGAVSTDDKAAAAGQVESALGRLLVVVENYPQLKSSETVQTLMAQLEGTENRVSVERTRFNDAVREYNTGLKRFPRSLVASAFGFSARNYFEAPAGAQDAPKVNLTQ